MEPPPGAPPAQQQPGAASVKLSAPVLAAMKELVPSTDPLDSAEFDAVAFVNELFPQESALSELDQVLAKLSGRANRAERELAGGVRSLAAADSRARADLERARQTIHTLLAKLRDIRTQAGASELMVHELCAGIATLDYAKRNLSDTATALRRLHMLLTALEQLKAAGRKQLGRAAELLHAINNLADVFDGYQDVPKVAQLHATVRATREQLQAAVYDEFGALDAGAARLTEACKVLDALGPAARLRFLDWFAARELMDYARHMKAAPGAVGGAATDPTLLENTETRYVWMRKAWAHFDDNYASVFPASWRVLEHITMDFAFHTRDALLAQLEARQRQQSLDVGALLRALQKTIDFEKECGERFAPGAPHPEMPLEQPPANDPNDPHGGANSLADERGAARAQFRLAHHRDWQRTAADELNNLRKQMQREEGVPADEAAARETQLVQELQLSRFRGVVSSCFDLYLHSYIAQEDRHMGDVFDKLLRDEPWQLPPEDRTRVLASAQDLIYYFEKTMKRIAELTRGQAFFDLVKLFKKYLAQFAGALQQHLPPLQADGQLKAPLTEAQEWTAALIANTADYCSKTTAVMTERIRARIQPAFVEAVQLDAEANAFDDVVAAALKVLSAAWTARLEPALAAMARVPWASMEAVGDTSDYVATAAGQLHAAAVLYERALVSPEHFSYVCDSMVTALVPQLRHTITHRCKRVSDVGVEQLLLDTAALKGALLDLPSVCSSVPQGIARRFAKLVQKEMQPLEMFIKVLMAPAEQLAANYRAFVGDGSEADFQRVLDLKGVSRSDARPLLDQFRLTSAGPGPVAPAAAAPAAAPAPTTASSAAATVAAAAGPAAATAAAATGSIKRLLSFTSDFL